MVGVIALFRPVVEMQVGGAGQIISKTFSIALNEPIAVARVRVEAILRTLAPSCRDIILRAGIP